MKGPSINPKIEWIVKINKVLSLGIVGEQVGAASHRRNNKGNSLDMRLPKIGEGMREKEKMARAHQNSIDSLKLPTLQKYKHGKYYMNNQKINYNKKAGKLLT